MGHTEALIAHPGCCHAGLSVRRATSSRQPVAYTGREDQDVVRFRPWPISPCLRQGNIRRAEP